MIYNPFGWCMGPPHLADAWPCMLFSATATCARPTVDIGGSLRRRHMHSLYSHDSTMHGCSFFVYVPGSHVLCDRRRSRPLYIFSWESRHAALWGGGGCCTFVGTVGIPCSISRICRIPAGFVGCLKQIMPSDKKGGSSLS